MLVLTQYAELVRDEIIQRQLEGYDTSDIEEKLTKIEVRSQPELQELFDDLENCPKRLDFPYYEPSELEQIKADWPGQLQDIPIALSEDKLFDKLYGGWLGRCVGCVLGKPVETLNKAQIEQWLRLADAYPLANYIPPFDHLPGDAPAWLSEHLSIIEQWTKGRRDHADWRPNTLLGRITYSVRDDELDYTIMRLDVVEDFGVGFTTMDIAEALLYQIPYKRIYSAERVAYRNLINGILPPRTATHLNPGREIMGALTRGDMWGYVAPGMPMLAVDMAYRDACLTHVKNGIYAELWVSAMISTAFVTDDISQIVEAGISVIPKNSRLAEALRDTVAWSNQHSRWEDVWEKIMQKYGHYPWPHTINNAALILLGVLYGKGDFERSITITVMSGLDTDSTGATVGSLLGVISGASALPDKWTIPLNDRVESYVARYCDSRIFDLAQRTLAQTKKVLNM